MTASTDCLCKRCAGLGKTCCQEREIYITPGDVARIFAFSGKQDFMEWTYAQDLSYLDQDDDPLWASHVIRADGSRRTLRRTPSGDCTFLGTAGCVLPVETRPLVCRLHPYMYNEAGITDEQDDVCPSHLLDPGQTLFAALDMSLDKAKRWHAQLYDEVRADTGQDLAIPAQAPHAAPARV